MEVGGAIAGAGGGAGGVQEQAGRDRLSQEEEKVLLSSTLADAVPVVAV